MSVSRTVSVIISVKRGVKSCIGVVRYCIDTAKHIIKLFHHLVDSPLHFPHAKPYGNIRAVTPPPPNGGVECKRSMKKALLSANISRYLGNDTR